jgi:hypothetical protein
MSKTKELTYVTSTCLNSKLDEKDPNYCDTAFHVVDKTNVKSTPPCQEYCDKCKAKGYKKENNKGYQKTGRKTLTEEQRKVIGERLLLGRLAKKEADIGRLAKKESDIGRLAKKEGNHV